jgi:hypothetical protein
MENTEDLSPPKYEFGPLPVPPVAVPGKGTFYRVAGGAFATRAEAQAACDRLRAGGQYCVVTGP